MRALEFIRDHVTFKLPYDFSYHMKTPKMRGGGGQKMSVFGDTQGKKKLSTQGGGGVKK